ncbi:MAG: OadG family protein [Clostridia bacterium]|nr:OadG family protein [Clostridia bacterium]
MSYLPIFLTAGLTMSEKFALSGEMLLRGMGTVFMVLVILWGCLSLFKVFSTPEKKSAPKKEAKPAPAEKPSAPAPAPAEKPSAPAPAPVAEEPVPAAPTPTDDAAVIAAICAAIEAYRAAEGLSGLPYRVVSFKRKTGRKSWSGGNED